MNASSCACLPESLISGSLCLGTMCRLRAQQVGERVVTSLTLAGNVSGLFYFLTSYNSLSHCRSTGATLRNKGRTEAGEGLEELRTPESLILAGTCVGGNGGISPPA